MCFQDARYKNISQATTVRANQCQKKNRPFFLFFFASNLKKWKMEKWFSNDFEKLLPNFQI